MGEPLDDDRLTAVGLFFETAAGLESVLGRQLDTYGLPRVWLDVLLRVARSPNGQLHSSPASARAGDQAEFCSSRWRMIWAALDRRCTPSVRMAEIFPDWAQRVAVFGLTRKVSATSLGVRRAEGSMVGSCIGRDPSS